MADPYGRVNAKGNLKTITLQDLLRPGPTVGDVQVLGVTNDLSIYHAGTASLERRFASGIGARFNLTMNSELPFAAGKKFLNQIPGSPA